MIPTLPFWCNGTLRAAGGLLAPLPGVDFGDYADALADRFRNPAIAHETYQIATDGTQKLPQRIFQPALAALDQGQDLRPFAFATAMWMRYCLGRRDDDTLYELRDPRAQEITQAIAATPATALALSDMFHNLPNLIPEPLAKSPLWRAAVLEILQSALTDGCVATLKAEAAGQ